MDIPYGALVGLYGTAIRDGAIARNSHTTTLPDPTAAKIVLSNMRSRHTCRPFAGDMRWRQIMGINKDQVEGRVKEAAGKVQEAAGKAVGSTTQQVKGAVNKTAGAAQAKYGDVKSDIKNDMNKNAKEERREERQGR
jgi:uncharacterized protein YjbJ (UPF0337 family)